MAKRIRAYTSKCGKDSYTLNYTQVASSHEYKIGLGEIFLCVKQLKIEKAGENPIIAERMVVPSGQHKGRIGFCDINTKEYIATFSGDKVTILDNNEEVDINNETSVKTYISALNKEDEARRAHAKEYKQNEGFHTTNYTPGQGIYQRGKKLDLYIDPKKSIVAQLTEKWRKKLTKLQLKHAMIIEREFLKAGLPRSIIAAAIVNAYWESGLRNIQSTCKIKSRGWKEKGYIDKKGRLREASFGLFQMNATASVPMKKGMTEIQRAEVRRRREQFRSDMLDPVKNCQKVIRRIKSRRPGSKKLLAAARAGASIAELTALFCIYIEIPADRFRRGRQRAGLSMKMFKHTERQKKEIVPPKGTAIKEWTRTPDRIGRLAKHKNVRTRISSGQDRWIFSSSQGTLMEMGRLLKSPKTGICAIGAYNAKNFFKYFMKYIWPRVKHFKLPGEIIIAGLYLNGAGSWGAKKGLEHHMRIVRFFRAKGVNVKIATCQPYPKRQNRINAFNNLIRTKGLTKERIDLAKKVAPKGTCKSGTLADGIHLSYKNRKQFAKDLEQA